jgi:hypothetical protein
LISGRGEQPASIDDCYTLSSGEEIGSTFPFDFVSLLRPVKTLAVLIVCLASVALADDIKTVDGKEYKDVTVKRVEPDGIVITHSVGVAKIPFTELPKDVQKRVGYDAAKIETADAATGAAEEKQIEEQRAAERERAERERKRAERKRERAERKQKAVADLTESEERFIATEKQAGESYKITPKGRLSGQVFVATKGGENFKLAAVKVSLFARDAMDVLVAELKAFANAEIEQLRLATEETGEKHAEAELQQAEAELQQAEAAVQQAQAIEQQAGAAVQQAEAIEQQAKAAEQQAKMTEKINWDAYQKTPGSNEAQIAAEGAKGAAVTAKAAADAASQALNAARQRVGPTQQGVGAAQQRVIAAQQGVRAAQQGVPEARQRDNDLLKQQAFYYSGSFYFSHLPSPIQTAETDVDGKFMIEVPRTGKFVIAVKGERSVEQKTEKYYWLEPVSLEGQRHRVQNLTNNDLTSATGTSSLILTKD